MVPGIDGVGRREDGQIVHFVADDEHVGLIGTRTVVQNVVVNGVDTAPFVDAELNSRMPELDEGAPDDINGFREAWAILQRLWEDTVARARRFPEAALHRGLRQDRRRADRRQAGDRGGQSGRAELVHDDGHPLPGVGEAVRGVLPVHPAAAAPAPARLPGARSPGVIGAANRPRTIRRHGFCPRGG